MLSTSDIYELINYAAFVETLFITISVFGLLYLRYTKPDAHRPIRVSFICVLLSPAFALVCNFNENTRICCENVGNMFHYNVKFSYGRDG